MAADPGRAPDHARNRDPGTALGAAAGPAEGDLLAHPDGLARCWWAGHDAEYVAYHDTEWGVVCRDEHHLFEKLCLEGFQAGLAWRTILHKRPAFRAAFADFHPARLSAFTAEDVRRLLGNPGIVRHRGKIEAAIANARAVCALRADGISLSRLVWSHAPEAHRRPSRRAEVPATSPEATGLATELRRHGFRYIGPTTAYAFMQAMGLVDDHLAGCWRATTGATEAPRVRQ